MGCCVPRVCDVDITLSGSDVEQLLNTGPDMQRRSVNDDAKLLMFEHEYPKSIISIYTR